MAKKSKAFGSIKHYGGIDPGKEGGLVLLEEINGKVTGIDYEKMPDTPANIFKAIKRLFLSVAHLHLEKVHSSPQMGVTSAFSFGYNNGVIEACLAACKVPYTLVTPQSWQGTLAVPKKLPDQKQAEHKRKLRRIAQAMYPNLELWDQLLGIQDAICDALLIAEHCRRIRKNL